MLTLGIETSGKLGSVALLDDDQLLAERRLSETGRRHARTLLPEIAELLGQTGHRPADCDLIAVSIGPGSFTGLRVGVVCAKTWAYATGCRVVAVDTLLTVAAACPEDVLSIDVTADAQRGDLYLGRYTRTEPNEQWRASADISIVRQQEWLDSLTPPTTVTGPALEKLAETLTDRCRILPPEHWHPTARHTALLGLQSFKAGHTDDPWTLKPLYLRRSAAEEKAET